MDTAATKFGLRSRETRAELEEAQLDTLLSTIRAGRLMISELIGGTALTRLLRLLDPPEQSALMAAVRHAVDCKLSRCAAGCVRYLFGGEIRGVTVAERARTGG